MSASIRRRKAAPGTSRTGPPKQPPVPRCNQGTLRVPPPPLSGGGGTRALGSRTECRRCDPRADLHHPQTPLQHRRAGAGELPRLHLRHGLRRSARRPPDRTERLRGDGAERDRPQAPRRSDPEAVPLLGPRRGHEPVRLDAPRQPPDPARALARDEEHAPTRADRPATRGLLRRPDRRLLRDQAVLRLRLHDDHLQFPRPRDARVLAGADGPGRRCPNLRTYGAPVIPDREPELGRSRHR